MLKKILRPFLHLAFLFKRPLTVGVRGICYDIEANNILLVKHIYSNGWALPGGGVEVGESAHDALLREVEEEVGLICKKTQILNAFHNNTISRRDHVIIYCVEIWDEVQSHIRPKLEINKSSWFKIDELPRDLTPCTLNAIEHFKTKNLINT
jgi:8-oxo-dGTP pyrophosphatase MutT (NUDIX family)